MTKPVSSRDDEPIKSLNYSAHAIEDLQTLLRPLRGRERDADTMAAVVELLQLSTKFILPNCAELLDPEHFTQAHMDLLKLPYPIVALEIPWKPTRSLTSLGGIPLVPASRRIALCWEPSATPHSLQALNIILEKYPQSGVFVLPISYLDQDRSWILGLGGTFIPYENSFRSSIDSSSSITKRSIDALSVAGLMTKRSQHFRAEPFILLQDAFRRHFSQDIDTGFLCLMNDTRDEAQALLQACAVLNCSNVDTVEIPPNAKLNKAREAGGKQPFFSYKILSLSADHAQTGNISQGGTHASPRMHLRRGHIRHLSQKTIWIRHTVVGSVSNRGVVTKDYKLTPTKPR